MSILSRYYEARARRRQLLQDIRSVDDRDLAGLGLNRSRFLAAAQVPAEQIDRMERMAALHGVREGQGGWHMLDVAGTCASCRHQERCREELSRSEGTSLEACDFCPNGPAFAQIARRS